MNRRELITKGAGAVAIAYVSGRAVAGNAFNLEPLCDNQTCANLLEAIAREIIQETGEWKRVILRDRAVKQMLVTRRGCCGCEITLSEDSNHPDWLYTRRNLTPAERQSFHEEYGQQAPLLMGSEIFQGRQIRGFILDGRKVGWNFSTRSIE